MIDKLKSLIEQCKCGVYLTVNEHRDDRKTAQQWLDELEENISSPDIDPLVRLVMIETNTVIELQFYPNTPIGSYHIVHHDLDAALTMAMQCLEQKQG
jgi:hypothetical protein